MTVTCITIFLCVIIASFELSWGLSSLFHKRLRRAAVDITSVLTFSVGTLSYSPSVEYAVAVSGGGKDFATKDLRGEDMSKKDFSSKDFTQCDATGVSFKGSNLRGSRFYRANLKDADFTGTNLGGASLEDTDLNGAVLTDAICSGSYFSVSILDTKSVTNADFTDAQMPDFALKKLCLRGDVKGTNPTTGVDTRESLFCE